MLHSRFFIVLCVLAATGVLCLLGTWQVQRLHWKEALIAEVAMRRSADPVALDLAEQRWSQTGDVDYLPVMVRGVFEHGAETYYYTTGNGAAGWNVFTPLRLDDGRFVLVNRGFVPDALRQPSARAEGQIAGTVTVIGLARNAPAQKPNFFVPDNDTAKRSFFWKDLPAMIIAAGLRQEQVLGFFIDAGSESNPGGWPKGGTTIVDFPNNHLQYAVTWFGLAAACLGVGLIYLLGPGRNSSAGRSQP